MKYEVIRVEDRFYVRLSYKSGRVYTDFSSVSFTLEQAIEKIKTKKESFGKLFAGESEVVYSESDLL